MLIKDYLNKNLQVISSPEPNLNWNNRADVGMRLSSYVPTEGYKNFYLNIINNRNNNSYIQINIKKEIKIKKIAQRNEVKFFNSSQGEDSIFFAPDSIERILDVCSLVAKNFMSFDLNVETLSEDLFTALAKPVNDYNNSAQKDIESLKQFYLR